MTKHEAPALKMLIENGRLVPVARWDQERVMSYRNGSVVSVRLSQEKNRKLERKYWAILHEVVDKCGIRQRTAEDLHKAIRLKLGVVDAYWTLDGKLRVDVKSTVGMEEPEYRQFFEDAMALLHKETGIDPLTLQSESADVGEDDNTQSSDLPTDEGSDGEVPPDRRAVVADPSEPADAADQEEDAQESSETSKPADGQSVASSSELSDEDRAWLKVIAKMLWAATGVGDQDILSRQFAGAREHQTPDTISKAARDRGNAIYQKLKMVCFGEKDSAEALTEIAMSACCDPKEIV